MPKTFFHCVGYGCENVYFITLLAPSQVLPSSILDRDCCVIINVPWCLYYKKKIVERHESEAFFYNSH